MGTALVALEGILRTEVGDPIPEGIKLYRVLAEHYRVVILCDESKEKAEHWLKANLIIGYADIYDDSIAFEGQDLRARQLAVAKSQGRIELFVDPDVDRCAFALANGVATMLFASPKFIRTTREVRPWEDLAAEVDRQRQAILDSYLGSNSKRFE